RAETTCNTTRFDAMAVGQLDVVASAERLPWRKARRRPVTTPVLLWPEYRWRGTCLIRGDAAGSQIPMAVRGCAFGMVRAGRRTTRRCQVGSTSYSPQQSASQQTIEKRFRRGWLIAGIVVVVVFGGGFAACAMVLSRL